MTNAISADPPSNRHLNASDYKTLGLAALGGVLEFYDFVIFVYFAVVLGQLFFPANIPDWLRQLQTFGVFAAGYFVRPLGGVVMAHFGDLFGRKRMFTLSIVLMAVATLGMGLLPTYAEVGVLAPSTLLLLRILQGAAIGGEVPGAWVFVAEHVPANRIGYACGSLTAGLTAGILLGSIVAMGINSSFSPAEIAGWAWRLPFLLGGAFGLLSVGLRRRLHETPIFKEMQARNSLASELPLKAVVRDHRCAVVVSMLLTWLLAGAIVLVILMTPALLQKLGGVSPARSLEANVLATFCLTVGVIVSGTVIDRIGAGRFFAVGSPLLGVAVWLFYTQGASVPALLLPTYAMAGFFVGIIGGVPFVVVRAFPAPIRFTGLSFSYNVAYAVFGGLTPVVVPLLLIADPLAHLHYMLALCALGCAVGLWLMRFEGSAGICPASVITPPEHRRRA
jgi:MFS transporter, MHS family, proline/betaine transporter